VTGTIFRIIGSYFAGRESRLFATFFGAALPMISSFSLFSRRNSLIHFSNVRLGNHHDKIGRLEAPQGEAMRLLIGILIGAPLMLAQQPAPQTFTSAADVVSMVEKAKLERKSDQANFIQPLLRAAPYRVDMEYRVRGIDTPPSAHPTAVEVCYVIEGTAMLTTGGKLQGEKPSGANLVGTGIEGGTSRPIAKGDFFLIPENTPHSFHTTAATLVIMSMHLPVSENK
jgi:quercetin dioxygenase-like cupin family protein